MEKKVLVETSARHVHLTEEQIEVLFGKGAKLTHKKDLSQPGQFACEERVTVVGPKRQIERVIILGPARKAGQVEVSFTDARTLGIDAPVRESGDVAGTPGCKLVGPCGELDLEEGVIVAKRHVHLDPATAEQFGVKDKQIVSLRIDNGLGRATVFGDLVVRVNPNFAPAVHLDTDESNAACAFGKCYGGCCVLRAFRGAALAVLFCVCIRVILYSCTVRLSAVLFLRSTILCFEILHSGF